MTFADFQPLYDFTLIEKAVQSVFVNCDGSVFIAPPDDSDPTRESWTAPMGNIGFYTAYQVLTFTQCRPRVFSGLTKINSVRGAYAVDANGNMREKAWTGMYQLGIITAPDYTIHTQLRSMVLAIIPQVLGAVTVTDFPNTGANAILQYHQISQFDAHDISTAITPAEGNYQSTIPVNLAFSVKPTAFPAGMITL